LISFNYYYLIHHNWIFLIFYLVRILMHKMYFDLSDVILRGWLFTIFYHSFSLTFKLFYHSVCLLTFTKYNHSLSSVLIFYPVFKSIDHMIITITRKTPSDKLLFIMLDIVHQNYGKHINFITFFSFFFSASYNYRPWENVSGYKIGMKMQRDKRLQMLLEIQSLNKTYMMNTVCALLKRNVPIRMFHP
jgi:hypothetical protein